MTTVNHAPAIPATPADRSEARLGVLGADRPCASCGFNLHGATIFRESHYQLVAVRCPECGTLAALQEYPALSRWTPRLRSLLGAVYLLVALGSLIIAGAIFWGISEGIASDVTAPYSTQINAALTEYQKQHNKDGSGGKYMFPAEIQDWWDQQSPSKFLADRGGLRGALNWWGLADWGIYFLLLFAMGVFWSVLFSHLRGRRLVLLMLAPTLIGLAFYYSSYWRTANSASMYSYASGDQFAAVQVGWVPALMTFGFGLCTLVLAALSGRRFARWFIATVLPPRLVPAFSFLWTADNRTLPLPAPQPAP